MRAAPRCAEPPFCGRRSTGDGGCRILMPHSRATTPDPHHSLECDVAIVGAGPVGLLLANLLGARGVRTLIIEKRREPQTSSMAIGITPPSLEILRCLGLD